MPTASLHEQAVPLATSAEAGRRQLRNRKPVCLQVEKPLHKYQLHVRDLYRLTLPTHFLTCRTERHFSPTTETVCLPGLFIFSL